MQMFTFNKITKYRSEGPFILVGRQLGRQGTRVRGRCNDLQKGRTYY